VATAYAAFPDALDYVGAGSLKGIPRRQTNPARWNGNSWNPFVIALRAQNIEVCENRQTCGVYASDSGGMAYGMPHGVTLAGSAGQISCILKQAQIHRVPVTIKGGGLTTEGETVAFGGLQLDMRGMGRVISVDAENMTVRAEAGIYWHTLAEVLRRDGLDYLSAPLNLTSSLGGTLAVGGTDVNSPRLGCSADHAVSLQVVTPTGDIKECSETINPELFERVLLGYGQFGVITEATMRIRKFTPITMCYFYYSSLREAMEDMQMLVREDAADYCGILTIMDKAVNLLVAFDSDARERTFFAGWRKRLRGHGESVFALRMAWHYALRPWRIGEALYLLGRKRELEPAFNPSQYMENGRIVDRAVVFGNQVWKFWGDRKMVIPDLAVSSEKFVEAIERGNAVCKKYFLRYTLYCVGIKLSGRRQRYELSCIPPDAVDFAYGCEFEPILGDAIYSRDYLQAFKNDIYDIGVEMKTSYYRFGGMMKGYIRRAFGDEVVDRHLAMKRVADPAMILNPNVVF
jgi:FAD/FMN-containing dehydrogenase